MAFEIVLGTTVSLESVKGKRKVAKDTQNLGKKQSLNSSNNLKEVGGLVLGSRAYCVQGYGLTPRSRPSQK